MSSAKPSYTFDAVKQQLLDAEEYKILRQTATTEVKGHEIFNDGPNEDYHIWRKRLMNKLEDLNVRHIIDYSRSIGRPHSATFKEWKPSEQKFYYQYVDIKRRVKNLIVRHIGNEVMRAIGIVDEGEECHLIIDYLDERCGSTTSMGKYVLLLQAFLYRAEPNESVQTVLDKLSYTFGHSRLLTKSSRKNTN